MIERTIRQKQSLVIPEAHIFTVTDEDMKQILGKALNVPDHVTEMEVKYNPNKGLWTITCSVPNGEK